MNYKRTQINKALEVAKMSFIAGGSYISTVRSWMQRKFNNGDKAIWGGNEYLSGTGLTPHDMELLAEDIKNAAIDEQFKKSFEAELHRLETAPW